MLQGDMMLRLLLIALLVTFSFSKEFEAKYSVDFSFLGKIGEAKIKYNDDGKRYEIELLTFPTGIVNTFSNNRKETIKSVGFVKDGILIPDQYKKHVKTNNEDITTTFDFDYQNKTIIEKSFGKKLEKKSYFDIYKFKMVRESKWEDVNKSKKLDFFAFNDLLTLAFNSKKILKDFNGVKTILAAGGPKNGKIQISSVSDGELKKISSNMNKEIKRVIAIKVTEDIFSDDNGKLYIGFDQNDIMIEALMKNVFLFGNIKGKKDQT
jgi:hypothetical protein